MSYSLPELVKADARCLDAAEIFLDAMDDIPSVVAFNRLIWELTRAKSLLRASEPRAAFERLFLRHLDASWTLLERVSRFRFGWPRMPVSELLDAIAGPAALDRLEQAVADLDPEEAWGFIEIRSRYRADRVPIDAPEAVAAVERSAAAIVPMFRSWLLEREGPLEGLDAEVRLGPVAAEHSWYEPGPNRVVLAPAEFMAFRKEGKVTINPLGALRSIAHELAGHAVQDALCRELPEPLRPDHRGRLRFASLGVAEGFADARADLSVAFAEKRQSDLGLTDQDLEMLRRMNELTLFHHAIPTCIGALATRARQEPGFDAAAHLAARVGHAGYGEMLGRASADTVYRLIYNASCFFGFDAVRKVAAELADEGVGPSESVRLLGKGGWALECYRDAVLGEEELAG